MYNLHIYIFKNGQLWLNKYLIIVILYKISLLYLSLHAFVSKVHSKWFLSGNNMYHYYYQKEMSEAQAKVIMFLFMHFLEYSILWFIYIFLYNAARSVTLFCYMYIYVTYIIIQYLYRIYPQGTNWLNYLFFFLIR